MQGISTLLASSLPWTGPSLWQSFLEQQREQSLLRDVYIGALLARIDEATRRAQISCVGLKGTALRALGIYAPGERPMGDVDLLIRTDDLESIDSVLRSLDYDHFFTVHRHIVYAPRRKAELQAFGEHIQNPLKIEVHTTVAESLPVSKVDITSSLQPALGRPGLRGYPDLAALMLHLLLHAAGNMKGHALRQIRLNDIAVLGCSLEDTDWHTLLAETETNKSRWWLFPPLALAERYYADSIPSYVLESARDACPRILRAACCRTRPVSQRGSKGAKISRTSTVFHGTGYRMERASCAGCSRDRRVWRQLCRYAQRSRASALHPTERTGRAGGRSELTLLATDHAPSSAIQCTFHSH
jgi:hypothetical protein